MVTALQNRLILFHLVTLVSCITNADKKEESPVRHVDVEDAEHDLDTQETGWLLDPLSEKMRKLEYLKNKVIYPFSALKSGSGSFGGGYPTHTVGAYYPSYGGSYPTYTFGSGSYYPSPKPKQVYYNPVYAPFKKTYPSYPYKTWYNKNYYSGGYQINTATYAPDCYIPPSYSTGTPLNYYYSYVTPSHSYGAPGFNFGAKAAVGFSSTPTPISYSSHIEPSPVSLTPPSSYIYRGSSSPQYSYDSGSAIASIPSLTSTSAPAFASITGSSYAPSVSSIPSLPTTPSPPVSSSPLPVVSTTPPSLPSFPNFIPSGPASTPIPIVYSQGDEAPPQEVIITPPPPSAKGHYVTTLPGPKVALPEPTYSYNQPSSYAVAYYPNVFYITNEQRLEKTSSTQSVGGTQGDNEETSDDSGSSNPTSESQATSAESPSTKSQGSEHTFPSPGLTTVYTSQTLDQTRIPIPYNSGPLIVPSPPAGFYSAGVPNFYSSSGSGVGPLVALSHVKATPQTNAGAVLNYPVALGQYPVGYQIARTAKNC